MLSTSSSRRRQVHGSCVTNDILANIFLQADDELEAPYLAGFEWDREECYTRFIVHQKKTGDAPSGGSSKKKKGKGEDA
jgi:hypothetical protein